MRGIVTPEDLKKGELFDAGWHPAVIKSYEEGEAGENAKNPGSATCTFHFEIIDGPGKGFSAKRLFSETAMGFAKNLYAALGHKKNAAGGYDFSTELHQSFVGRKLKIYNKHSKSDRGNMYNDIQDFQPLS